MADLLDFIPLYPDDTEDAILARMREWANEGRDPSVDAATWVDTREGSHWHIGVMPAVRELARLYDLAGTEVAASGLPLYAWGSYLDAHAEVQTIERLPATLAGGHATFAGAAGSVVASGVIVGVEPVVPDDDVPSFEVTAGGTIPAAADPPTGLAGIGVLAGGTLTAEEDWAYRVSAVDDAGETLAADAVLVVAAAGGPGHIALTWDEVPTATGYRVYRANELADPFGLIAEVTAPAWDDTGAVAPDMDVSLPGVNSTGGKLTVPIRATEAGVVGNVAIGAITVIESPGLGVLTVTNGEPTVGGSEVESDGALRARVLSAYRGQGAGNRADYERWAGAWAGVGRVTVIPLWNGPGTVKVIVSDADGRPVSPETVATLQVDLDPTVGRGDGRAPISAIVTVETAVALSIEWAATIEFEEGYSLDGDGGTIATRPAIVGALRAYTERVESGGEVVYEQGKGRIVTIEGVHDVSDVTLNGDVVNVPVDDDPAEAPTLADADVVLTEAP